MSNTSFSEDTITPLIQNLRNASAEAERVLTDMWLIAVPGVSRREGREPTKAEEDAALESLRRLVGDAAKDGWEPGTEEHAAMLWEKILDRMRQSFRCVGECWQALAKLAAVCGRPVAPFSTAAELMEQMALGNVRIDETDNSYRAALELIRLRLPSGDMPLDALLEFEAAAGKIVGGTGDEPAAAGGGGKGAGAAGNGDNAGYEARAVALRMEHPDWTNKQIAQAVGCHEKTLSHYPTFRATTKAVKSQAASILPTGSKNGETGDLEAWDNG